MRRQNLNLHQCWYKKAVSSENPQKTTFVILMTTSILKVCTALMFTQWSESSLAEILPYLNLSHDQIDPKLREHYSTLLVAEWRRLLHNALWSSETRSSQVVEEKASTRKEVEVATGSSEAQRKQKNCKYSIKIWESEVSAVLHY